MPPLFLLVVSMLFGGDPGTDSLAQFAKAESYQFTLEDSYAGAPVAGKYQKGLPVAFRADGIDFFRRNDILVYKEKDTWQRTRTGTLSDPLRILGPSARVRSARLPHEETLDIAKTWTAVKSSEEKGKKILHGELNEKAAMLLARSEQRSVARSGKATVWLDAKGNVAGYRIELRLLGRIGGADVDGATTRTVQLSEVGATKLEVPAAAAKALE